MKRWCGSIGRLHTGNQNGELGQERRRNSCMRGQKGVWNQGEIRERIRDSPGNRQHLYKEPKRIAWWEERGRKEGQNKGEVSQEQEIEMG
jgi:hypothetical protein